MSSLSTSLELVASGYGYAWLPAHRVADLLARGVLRSLPLRVGGKRLEQLYLNLADEDKLGPAATYLLNCIRSTQQKSV